MTLLWRLYCHRCWLKWRNDFLLKYRRRNNNMATDCQISYLEKNPFKVNKSNNKKLSKYFRTIVCIFAKLNTNFQPNFVPNKILLFNILQSYLWATSNNLFIARKFHKSMKTEVSIALLRFRVCMYVCRMSAGADRATATGVSFKFNLFFCFLCFFFWIKWSK